jgi:hypothetical protein
MSIQVDKPAAPKTRIPPAMRRSDGRVMVWREAGWDDGQADDLHRARQDVIWLNRMVRFWMSVALAACAAAGVILLLRA